MPAPDSILTRKKDEFPPLAIARKLYKRTLDACLKMPKRYTYLILQDVIQIAGHILDDVKRANSVFVTNAHEFQIRRDYWISARANLEALSTRIDTFLETGGFCGAPGESILTQNCSAGQFVFLQPPIN